MLSLCNLFVDVFRENDREYMIWEGEIFLVRLQQNFQQPATNLDYLLWPFPQGLWTSDWETQI